MSAAVGPAVTLVGVDEPMLGRLVEAPVAGAFANDVTPPVTTGSDWSSARIAWLKDFTATAVTD